MSGESQTPPSGRRVTHFELTIISPHDSPIAEDVQDSLLDGWGFPAGVEVVAKEVLSPNETTGPYPALAQNAARECLKPLFECPDTPEQIAACDAVTAELARLHAVIVKLQDELWRAKGVIDE